MEDFLNQVEAAANVANLYYLALSGALLIPDMCAALESTDGQSTGARYVAWFNTHVAPLHEMGEGLPILTGTDCYLFRCSFLHQGTTKHSTSRYSRILFVEPGASGLVLHMNILNDALNIDVQMFCQEMVAAARNWIEQVSGTETYETNLVSFIRRHPDDLAPYIGGVAVIS